MSNRDCSIAIVGMACIYPGARTPNEFWENIMAQRKAFRRLPPERLRIEDYFSADKNAPDATYAMNAAVIEGYSFDRAAFNVVGTTYRAADLAHWLALDVASQALADAGFAAGAGLPKCSTGVLVGNTLTGEFSRANALRVRWPYVRRTIEAALARHKWTPDRCENFLRELEERYKSPFPEVGEEWLAGGLSNTIAGRICNHFDLKGGGFTVDGACASSLLAVANACSSLVTGDLDVAIAGGVDLSLDPFEIIGFAKIGALANDEMHVFDKRSSGFLPGEGCGMAVLMRHEDAIRNGRRVYAVIKGWGISSDGNGGITRPEPGGQLEAIRRAYRKAGFGIETVAYCEGHGTGTVVGDSAELEVLRTARRESNKPLVAAALGSVKANIGHTKAAAGIAGLIKATLAVHKQVLPPTTGCEMPHARIEESGGALRVLREPQPWPESQCLRASVSAMGFGGINAHIVLENPTSNRKSLFSAEDRKLARSCQDVELFVFQADTHAKLLEQIEQLLPLATRISSSEMTDLAAALAEKSGNGKFRAAILAQSQSELAERMEKVVEWLTQEIKSRLDIPNGIFLGSGNVPPSIGFLLPGQASPLNLDGGIWKRRFESVRTIYSRHLFPNETNHVATTLMQPAIVRASLVGLAILERLDINAVAAVGHSLGELTALHWAGAFDAETLLRVVRARSEAMASHGESAGAMLAIAASEKDVRRILKNDGVSIVGLNSPRQTVLAGPATAVQQLGDAAKLAGFSCCLLPVSHAFHTSMMSRAVLPLADKCRRESFSTLKQCVYSTVTGDLLQGPDLSQLLCDQLTAPVQFMSAFEKFSHGKDFLIEVGPGNILTGLAKDLTKTPVVALDAGGESLKGLFQAVGAAFALGAPVKVTELFNDRFTRPFNLNWSPKFFANPCELAPLTTPSQSSRSTRAEAISCAAEPLSAKLNSIQLVQQIVAARTELPVTAIAESARMLSDLHLNSITVGQLVAEVARQSGIPRITGLTDFANASVLEIAEAIDELKAMPRDAKNTALAEFPAGVDRWTRALSVEWLETRTPMRSNRATAGNVPPPDFEVFPTRRAFPPENLSEMLVNIGFAGALVWLPEHPDESAIAPLLAAARHAIDMKGRGKFVVVQHGWGGSGFSKTLHVEHRDIAVLVVNLPPACPAAVEWIANEIVAVSGFAEVRFDSSGRRFEPRLSFVELAGEQLPPAQLLDQSDVLLVTGGGKGIAAECALAYAAKTGVALGLIGRSDPAADKELNANLRRFSKTGIRCRYFRADIGNRDEVQAAVAYFQSELGPITGFLHGAGVNTPALIEALDEKSFRNTLSPKVRGFHNVMASINQRDLKLLVTFGSIIARTGLHGQADYAAANEWLSVLTDEFKRRHPSCQCLALEWSVWAGAGMGERLGRVEALASEGIEAISIDAGVELFGRLVREPAHPTCLIVAGRFGKPSTVKFEEPQLPLHRFLERKAVFYPGVELVVEFSLSTQSDPYLLDHIVDKQPVFPAVMGIEAMAQVAMVLSGSNSLPVVENLEFLRPVLVSDAGQTTIRIAALRREIGVIEMCMRSSETDYQVDHFRASCRNPSPTDSKSSSIDPAPCDEASAQVNPDRDLYGSLLFHGKRFRRLAGYRHLSARKCTALILPDDSSHPWFGPYLPHEFVLGHPAARDAGIHAIQACIPHLRILPTGVERVIVYRIETGPRMVQARERRREGRTFIYDVDVMSLQGEPLERYEGLRLHGVEEIPLPNTLPDALVAAFLERRFEELVPQANIRVALGQGSRTEDKGNTDAQIQKALGRAVHVLRRPDGRPFIAGPESVSASHSGNYTLAVAGEDEISCDLELIGAHSAEDWESLLGAQGFLLARKIGLETRESINNSCTRIWTAIECTRKIGQTPGSAFVIESANADGWSALRSGSIVIHSVVISLPPGNRSFVVAVAAKPNPANTLGALETPCFVTAGSSMAA